jgi:HNH endonuclease
MYSHVYGRTRTNESFSPDIVEAVWRKGLVITDVDPNTRRKDTCGALIDRDQYGVTKENGTGWEIDHIIPVSNGGRDELSNYQPLQCRTTGPREILSGDGHARYPQRDRFLVN